MLLPKALNERGERLRRVDEPPLFFCAALGVSTAPNAGEAVLLAALRGDGLDAMRGEPGKTGDEDAVTT